MKSRIRFIRVVIVATVIILLLVRFVGKWHYAVVKVPFMDVDSNSVPSELVCRILIVICRLTSFNIICMLQHCRH